jgi:hypothetical protein
MRGFVAFVLVLVAALVAAALLLVPAVIRPIVVDQVRAALPFEDQPVDVDVDVNPVRLLLGTVDSIHVAGDDLDTNGAGIGRLDVTFRDVSTTSHAFRSISGILQKVALPFVQDTELVVDSIAVEGTSDAGIPVASVELVDGGISTTLFDQPVQVAIGVDAGSLVLVDVAGGGPMTILAPAPDDPWRITGVKVTPSGMSIEASIGTADLLGP